jgi:hypothetical protein
VLLDAPSVLGIQEVRRIEEVHTMAGLRAALAACVRAGEVDAACAPMLAHLILGALAQVAMAITRAEGPPAARDEA